MLDHLFVGLFAVAWPIAGAIGFRRYLRRVRDGGAPPRLLLYRNTLLGHWILLGLGLAVWALSGRSWEALGLGLRADRDFFLGALLALAVTGFFALQLRSVAGARRGESQGLRFGNLEPLMPRTPAELRRFHYLSLTAGVVEEILWRGFLIWYLDVHLPLWAAAIAATVAFTLAHAYQGARQLPTVLAAGAGLTGLYLLTGSVWLSVVLHAAVDALQGRLAYTVIRRRAGKTGVHAA